MTDKTKRIVLIAVCCLLCVAAAVGIAVRFGGNADISSGVVSDDPTQSGNPSVDIDNNGQTDLDVQMETPDASETDPAQGADSSGLEQTIQAVRTAADKPGVKAIICKSSCIAVSKPAKRLQVDESRCVGCKQCIRELGCPAISLKGQKAYIEPDLCFGCTICAQVCKPGSIREEDAQ